MKYRSYELTRTAPFPSERESLSEYGVNIDDKFAVLMFVGDIKPDRF